MKKFSALLLSMCLATVAFTGCGGNTQPETTATDTTDTAATTSTGTTTDFGGAELVVATWGWSAGNIQKLAENFEATYNCKIVIDETAGNSDRLNKIKAQKNNPQIDVALLSQNFAVLGNEEGLFEKIDPSIVTNLDNLYDFAKNEDGFGPAYSLVRYGIIYDASKVSAPTSYMDLFTNSEYAGKLSLPDMTSTAGPYLLVTLAEELGGSQEDVEAAFALLQENKDNVAQWYSATSDVTTGFTTGDIAISVFMDMNMPGLTEAGIDAQWVEPTEGCFPAAATANVVAGSPNPELAQLFVNYLISDEIQNQVADVLSEAPVTKNATMSDDKKAYLASDSEAFSQLKAFDDTFISTAKSEWIEKFQREVAIQ